MRVLLDTNIVIDGLRKRPFDETGLDMLEAMQAFGDVECWVSSKSCTDIFYVIRKEIGSAAAQDIIEESLTRMRLCSIDEQDVKTALGKRWDDFEDCLVDVCAQKVKADFLITRDVAGFERSRIPHGTASDFMAYVKETLNVEYAIGDI